MIEEGLTNSIVIIPIGMCYLRLRLLNQAFNEK